jgi:hypothetical protein
MSRISVALSALVVAGGTVLAAALPANADSAYFGFSVGGYPGPSVGFGYYGGAPYPYRPAPVYRGWRPAQAYRGPVDVCQDVWRTRRVRDEWGRVVRVVKVRDQICGPAWR